MGQRGGRSAVDARFGMFIFTPAAERRPVRTPFCTAPDVAVSATKLLGWWSRLRSTYWFVPSIITLLSTALGAVLIDLDAQYPDAIAGLGWLYRGGADGARSLLSAVAGSMVTVVSVTFSVTVVALTVSADHFGPRLLNNFMRDNASQAVLGTFIGTFSYCVLVLRTVRGEDGNAAAFVPQLAVTGGVVLTLVSVATLIYFVHHVSTSLQVSRIAESVATDLERAFARLYPQRIGEAGEAEMARPVPRGARPSISGASGYVQAVDADKIVRWASRHDAVVWVLASPGAFVTAGARLAMVDPAPDDHALSSLRDAFVLGNDRTSDQDAGFAVQQLVEVALRALSPGMNEPFTAITCIDRLGQGLAILAERAIPSSRRHDSEGRLRVVAVAPSFPDMLYAAFGLLRGHVGQNVAVAERLLDTMAMLAGRVSRDEDRVALSSEIEETHRAAQRDIDAQSDRVRLTTARNIHGLPRRRLAVAGERQHAGRRSGEWKRHQYLRAHEGSSEVVPDFR